MKKYIIYIQITIVNESVENDIWCEITTLTNTNAYNVF